MEDHLEYLRMNIIDSGIMFLRQVVLNDGIPFEIKKLNIIKKQLML